jgi:hypothetical protein
MSEVGQLGSLSAEGSDAEVVGGAGGDGWGWWHIRAEEGDARLTESIYIGDGENGWLWRIRQVALR